MLLASSVAFLREPQHGHPVNQREQGHTVPTNALHRPQIELVATRSSPSQEEQFVILTDQAGQKGESGLRKQESLAQLRTALRCQHFCGAALHWGWLQKLNLSC